MAVGIIDLDMLLDKRHYIINLDVMQISSYYKNLGERVRLVRNLSPDELGWFKELYVIYNGEEEIFYDYLVTDPRTHLVGKYFYGMVKTLPQEIIDSYPDRSIYDGVLESNYFSYSRKTFLYGLLKRCDFIRLHEPSNYNFLTDNAELGIYDVDITEKDIPEIQKLNKKFYLFYPLTFRNLNRAKEWLDNKAYMITKSKKRIFIADNFIKQDLMALFELPPSQRKMFTVIFGNCSAESYNLDLKKMITFVEKNKFSKKNIYFTVMPIKDEIYKKLYQAVKESYYARKEVIYRSKLNLKDRNIYNFMVKIKATDPELYKLLSYSKEDRLGEEARGKEYRRMG